MKKTRLAAIDIGTNSIRCIVVEVDQQGRFTVLDDEKATVRLGENLGRSGAISPAACGRAVEAISRMRMLIDGFKVSEVEAIATSAIRNASNGRDLVEELSRLLGREIKVISGQEEAELAAISALHNFEMSGKRYVMIDIGGGSVELVTALGSHIEECFSVDLGAVLMTEQFFTSDPIRSSDYQKFRRHVRTVLKKTFSGEKISAQNIIGSGGTITSLGNMVMSMRRQTFSSVHGYEVLRSEVVHLLAMLMRKDLKARRSLPGLNPDRADIIVAGCAVVDELMRFFGANQLRVNERGIREGLIIRTIKRLGLIPDSTPARTWRDSVLEFARSCHYDEPHSRHVASLSLAIFDRLAQENGLKKTERRLLEAAALLHDSGYFIGYTSHHKHSYHLIRHAELFGLTPREREIIAQVARYHRKALPKKKHLEFSKLSEKDQLIVSRLGGILRLADGLDRRRSGLVEVVDLSRCGSTYTFRLSGTEDITVEIFGGNAKRDLFEKAFGGAVVFVTG
ncbi:Ppx/GppA phosphatase family protein [Geobacter sp. SVR]|uniref:Ppx/GppA phosphatase family protein n=1 Tax=Geobacter sp. SVR TaxID=2495594 RepID=UPI00143F0425|nr:Ppx/GppA phosphatase family protein [Geobacter sp. SVR]BCS53741.1 exopolyphosphatase [Geobacter sp. SVR]GCF85750.1 exopolyphosphatase [Geobacter sp. SVR]